MTLTIRKKQKRKQSAKQAAHDTRKNASEPKPLSIAEQIRDAGFQVVGHNTYQRNGHVLDIDDAWLTVTDTQPLPATAARTFRDHPGPWRLASSTAEHGRFHKVFEVPGSVIHAAQAVDADFGNHAPMRATLQWAIDTANGHRNGWIAPQHGEVVQQLKKTSLTVQAGGIVRETLIDHGEHHLAFRCPVLTHLPDGLPQVRRDWLDASLHHAQNQWRLVRFKVDEEQGAVIAEVDLTGVPHALIESFVPVAVDALRWSVSWLAKSAAVIVDASIESVLLAAAPYQAMPEERSGK